MKFFVAHPNPGKRSTENFTKISCQISRHLWQRKTEKKFTSTLLQGSCSEQGRDLRGQAELKRRFYLIFAEFLGIRKPTQTLSGQSFSGTLRVVGVRTKKRAFLLSRRWGETLRPLGGRTQGSGMSAGNSDQKGYVFFFFSLTFYRFLDRI